MVKNKINYPSINGFLFQTIVTIKQLWNICKFYLNKILDLLTQVAESLFTSKFNIIFFVLDKNTCTKAVISDYKYGLIYIYIYIKIILLLSSSFYYFIFIYYSYLLKHAQ